MAHSEVFAIFADRTPYKQGKMKYPIGIQSFETIRQDGYVYVDKTAHVYRLADTGKYYFLSRPRRFGKSLLISTMEAYFLGKKELFHGLAMEKLEKEWTEYPVLHLDLNADAYNTPENLVQVLDNALTGWESIYDKGPAEQTSALRFKGVIQRAYAKTGRQVVVLVDEYDKPLLNTIDNPTLHDSYRAILKGFFGNLKSQDRYIRFAFLTGVSRFSHVSVFSDLNNLKNITMDPRYADICGISEKELRTYFEKSIQTLADTRGLTYEETREKLKERYDGYHFCENSIGVYNPYSLLNAFDMNKFDDYWFETGTPTFLVRLLLKNDYKLSDLSGMTVTKQTLTLVDERFTNLIPVLCQTGYLTITGYNEEREKYTIDYPNQEVKRGFLDFLVPYYLPLKQTDSDRLLDLLTDNVQDGKPEEMLLNIQTLLSGKPYMLEGGNKEVHFQNSLYLIFTILGYNVQVEQATSQGRIDVTIQTRDYVYIMELKLDRSAEEALAQIKERNYARPFRTDPRKKFLIGVNFSSETRTVEKWIVEEA